MILYFSFSSGHYHRISQEVYFKSDNWKQLIISIIIAFIRYIACISVVIFVVTSREFLTTF